MTASSALSGAFALVCMALSLLGLLALLYVAVRGYHRAGRTRRAIERGLPTGYRRAGRGWVRLTTGERR